MGDKATATREDSDGGVMEVTQEKSNTDSTIVVGAGLAGLSCAVRLAQQGHSVTVLEASDRVGGRVRSDVVDGFTLDYGFQVLLTAYPACQALLDYDSLRLRRFNPGALIRSRGKFAMLSDPWRRPTQLWATAMADVGTLGDKIRVGLLRRACQQGSIADLYQRDAEPTAERLQACGFTANMIDSFFRPFLGGVMLDESLTTSSRMLEFVFRMFASGDVAVPADGMAAIPRQLADQLPRGSVRFNSSVVSLDYPHVGLSDGSTLTASNIVLATESSAAARLLGTPNLATSWHGATTIYYAAHQSPDHRKMLMLRGDEEGPVQTAVVLSDIAPQYAPAGRELISVSISDQHKDESTESLDLAVKKQLRGWFQRDVDQWQRLRCYRVPFGLPQQSLDPVVAPIDGPSIGAPEGVYVCGDHRETASIQGAMNSGMRVASAITRS
tara:strand:- start:26372 stop:27694 length:1323 start_codon:yes stop_codon:yes gene_type:complete